MIAMNERTCAHSRNQYSYSALLQTDRCPDPVRKIVIHPPFQFRVSVGVARTLAIESSLYSLLPG